jgi:HSP20 family protein
MTKTNFGDVPVTLQGTSTSAVFNTTSGNTSLTFGYSPSIGTTSLFNSGNSLIQPTYDDFWNYNEEWDLLWKSFFDSNAGYRPIKEKVASIPCDIQETENGLLIEIAAVGLDKEDLDIIVDSETLRVAYRKTDKEEESEKNEYRYLLRTIKKASFDIGIKISSKYDLQKMVAALEKGLLILEIPFAKENKPKKVTIK